MPCLLEKDRNDNVVKEYIAEKYNKPGNVFLGVVHRLDRPTTGIIVFARTSNSDISKPLLTIAMYQLNI